MQNNPMSYPDIASLLNKIQGRLASLENKVDSLINRISLPMAAVATPLSAPVQKPASANPENAGKRDNRNVNKVRQMFKAICADCKKECEVPFRPSGDRPVYCRECFARRKAGNSLRSGIDAKPKEAAPAQIEPVDEKLVDEKEKPVPKKEPVGKKKPAVKKKPAHKVKKAAKKPIKKKAR
jgi:CxxC-x17-CxxC domain-containing protein